MNIALFIHGKASAGKDYFVKGLKIHHLLKNSILNKVMTPDELMDGNFHDPKIVISMPFADEVRRELCRLDPLVEFDRLCHDYTYKAKYRKELVEIGNGYRQDNPGIWVEKHYATLKKWNEENNGKIVCIPDMRYDTDDQGSEYTYSKEINEWGKIVSFRVKINAPLGIRLNRMSPEGVAAYVRYGMNNPSETSMDHLPNEAFDYVCDNSSNCRGIPNSFLVVYNEILNLWTEIRELE